MRRACLLALIGLAAGGPLWAGPSTARAVIERCAHAADAGSRGIDALRARCPDIETAVRELGLEPLLPADWHKTASASGLVDLAALADRYAAPLPALRLDGGRLKIIARQLEPPPAAPSVWERIEAWIRNWLEPKAQGTSSWLRFLPRWQLSPQSARLIFGALAALIILTIAALVVRELSASGLLGSGRKRRTPRRAALEARPTDGAPLDLESLDSALARERPAILLGFLVRALIRSHRLGHDRNLTCRELTARARFDSSRQRERFEEVALLAERTLYGAPALVPPEIPDEMLTTARALHAELLADPRSEPAGS